MWIKGPVSVHIAPSDTLPAPLALHIEIAALAELSSPGSGRARFAIDGPGQAAQEVGYATRLQHEGDVQRYADPGNPSLPDPAAHDLWVVYANNTTPRYLLIDGPALRNCLEEALTTDPRNSQPFARERGAAPYHTAAAGYDGIQTLSDLADSCETCGGRAVFSGRADPRGSYVYAVLRCAQCRVDFPVWSRNTETALAAWLTATVDAPDRLRLYDALSTLRSGAGVEALITAAEHGRRLPWIGFRETRIPPALVERWLTLVLEGTIWAPAPQPRGRIVEALTCIALTGAGTPALASRVRSFGDDLIAWGLNCQQTSSAGEQEALRSFAALLDAARLSPELSRKPGRT